MKKTLIAVSLSALAAGSANAAVTLNETETGSFSTYGKINLQLQNKDAVNQIQDNGSRFGFSGESVINEDMKAFANAEFRFNAGYKNDTAPTVRYSYAGVEGGFGKVTAGNFDSVYYTAVASSHDILEAVGYDSLDNKGEGFSLAYETLDLNGLKVLVGLRHFSEGDGTYPADSLQDTDDDGVADSGTGDEAWNAQVAATYALSEELSLGVAFDQNNEDTSLGGADPIIGASINYSADAFGAFTELENSGDIMMLNVGGNFSYGAGDVYGLVAYRDNGTDTGMDLAVGANYNLNDDFYVYSEFAQGNDDNSTGDLQVAGEGVSVVSLGAVYNW
ncbi:porin [Marinospirillum sp.]|uniref:porin n=1 Tax=Marinospirillum sp. TaxID=2183934 RepID=UPI00384B8FD5